MKNTKQAIPTEAEFKKALADHQAAHNEETALSAKVDAAVAKVRNKHVDRLQELNDIKVESKRIAQLYCEHNEAALFVEKRSYETPWAVVGFKKNPASVQLCEGKTWDEVVADLKKRLPDYVRTKEEADKAAIIKAAKTDPKLAARLDSFGMVIEQKETFYLTPAAA